MSKKNILDVPTIQKEIREKHKRFIKDFGSVADKISADHQLLADIALAKLYRVALIYKEEGVISDLKVVATGPYRQITLSKIGNDIYVNITTNGKDIIMEGFTYSSGLGSDLQHLETNKTVDVNDEDFDWVRFSIGLLDYIHATIYGRKEALEAKIGGMLQDFDKIPEKNDEAKKRKAKNGNK